MIAMLHTMAPVVIISCGMAMVVMTGNLDISLGSIAFLSSSIGVLLMIRLDWDPVAAFSVTVLCGIAFGMLNGFIVVVLGINPLITTLVHRIVETNHMRAGFIFPDVVCSLAALIRKRGVR